MNSDWKVLPTQELYGAGTPMTESTFSWAARSCWTAGIVPTSLSRLLGGANRTTVWPSLFEGATIRSSLLIDDLQKLTHTPNLRGGSFSAISPIAGKNFLGSTTQWLRWCPVCTRELGDHLYIPLIFSMTACRACPVHGCLIESNCRNCGRKQRKSWCPQKWTACTSCGAGLSVEPRYRILDTQSRWVLAQCEALVVYAAKPNVDPQNSESISTFFHELEIAMAMDEFDARGRIKIKDILSRDACHKITFAALLEFSSILGVGVVDILERPHEAASPRLLKAESSIELGAKFAVDSNGAERLTSMLADGEWFNRMGYVPSTSALLRATRLRRSHLAQVPQSVKDAYDRLESRCLHPQYMDMEVCVQKSTKLALALLTGRCQQSDYLQRVGQSTRFLRSACEEDVQLIAVVCLRIATHWFFSTTSMSVDLLFSKALRKLLPTL